MKPFDNREQLFQWVCKCQYFGVEIPYGVICKKSFFDELFEDRRFFSEKKDDSIKSDYITVHFQGASVACILEKNFEEKKV